MRTTAEALNDVLTASPTLSTERVALADSVGRVLREDIKAERDQPPFNRITMDGIAVDFATFDRGARLFPIAGRVHAGDAPAALDDSASCLEVMTGAVLPAGADTVIPVERLTVVDGDAKLEDGYIAERGQFVHPQGSDHTVGTALLAPGCRITANEIAVLASAGCDTVAVASQPRIRILSTGDELVPAGRPILPHQVRLSNGPTIAALLSSHGFTETLAEHIVDDKRELTRRLADHLSAADVVVLSGGVSMGKADYVPGVLASLGVEQIFHRVRQRPGKPMWFGRARDGTLVFGLPGNPVSAIVCCRQYVIPALLAASQYAPKAPMSGILDRAISFSVPLTRFVPAIMTSSDGNLRVTPVTTNTSGDFAALTGSDGYVELDADTDDFAADSTVPFHPWQLT